MHEYCRELSYQSTDRLSLSQLDNYTIARYVVCSNHSRLWPINKHSTQISMERFYRAFMARTFDAKILQGLAIFLDSSKIEIADPTYDKIMRIWSDNPHRSLRDSAEILEMFDYVSNFLLFRVFSHPNRFLDWRGSIFLDENGTFLDNWMSFVGNMQPFLTPSDILELFQRGEHLEVESFQETFSPYIKFSIRDQKIFELPIPAMKEIENDISTKLTDSAAEKWESFRRCWWRSSVRGRVFTANFNLCKDIIDSKECDSRKFWWEYLQCVGPESMESSSRGSFAINSYLLIPLRNLTRADDEAGKYDRQFVFLLDEPPSGFLT